MSKREYPVRFMAIDAGSNATKYRVWDIEAVGKVTLTAERRYPIRLGEGVFTSGRIADETIAAAVEVFRSIREDAENYGVNAMRSVTTSAAREAQNRDALVGAIRRETGIQLEILSDEDEARLIGLGILAARPESNGPCAMIDIGGGSTEFIVARGGKIEWAISVPIGAVRMKEMFFKAIPPREEEIDALENHIQDVLLRMLPKAVIGADTELIGSGGTIVSLTLMSGGNGGVTLNKVESTIERLHAMDVKQICETYPVDEARAEIILAGSLVCRAIMKHIGLSKLLSVRGGVSDGLMREFCSSPSVSEG